MARAAPWALLGRQIESHPELKDASGVEVWSLYFIDDLISAEPTFLTNVLSPEEMCCTRLSPLASLPFPPSPPVRQAQTFTPVLASPTTAYSINLAWTFG
ncbi:hypothetical protein HGRIS_011261 [Hohenbuehelia grisea]|uniref:Uncharacterized protein n=1 Tax=Hohenbuehelia grisea TaxID=104357 RepID=A0ABR3JUS1_9AGAR